MEGNTPDLKHNRGRLRSVDLRVRNCVNPASSLCLAAGAFSRNSLPINLHISVEGTLNDLDNERWMNRLHIARLSATAIKKCTYPGPGKSLGDSAMESTQLKTEDEVA